MFCRKCGGENVDGDKFCKHCGHPIGENAENQTTQNTATEKNDILKSINVNQLMDKIKVVPKKIIAGVLAVIILIPVIIGLIMSSAATIKLDQFIIIEANGYDGYEFYDPSGSAMNNAYVVAVLATLHFPMQVTVTNSSKSGTSSSIVPIDPTQFSSYPVHTHWDGDSVYVYNPIDVGTYIKQYPEFEYAAKISVVVLGRF